MELIFKVENILESRARSMDLTTHNYYDLLYAFHIYRNNYRKGTTVFSILHIRLVSISFIFTL